MSECFLEEVGRLTIEPSSIWPDDRGEHINAHGGGILRLGDTWFWFGEYRPADAVQGRRYVSCYASEDLVKWEFRGLPIDMTAPNGFGPHWVLERPKVFYNVKTQKFVMYMHLDGPSDPNDAVPSHAYALAQVGVAVSDTAEGPYEFVRSFQPLGKESRDIGQFVDDDGRAYLIFESRPTGGFYIASLSDDYLDVEEEVAFVKAPIEGGALVHYEGLYYLLGSALTGWDTNPNKYATANDLRGPWSEFKDIAPPETNTYESQSTLLVKVAGTDSTTVIYMGDQWKPEAQWDSRYLWMPVEIGDGRLRLPEPCPWTLDVTTGVSQILPQSNCMGEALPARNEVLEAMVSANRYFVEARPTGYAESLPRGFASNIWTRGTYFEGALALYEIDQDPAILQYALDWARFHEWQLNNGSQTEDPDDQCAGQAYIALQRIGVAEGDPLKNLRANLDHWTCSGKSDHFTWVDTFQMSMPCFAALGVEEGRNDYLEKMFVLYDYAKTDLGLYNPADKLWWRDERFKPPYESPNGKQTYWSRGNGWVIAGMARVLDELGPEAPHFEDYLEMLKNIAEALLPLQREDGFWNVNLADPEDFGGPETTGTSLFVYGLAWGINRGHLPPGRFLSPTVKAWRGMVTKALHSSGFLGFVQGTGSKPEDSQPVEYDTHVDFDDFGVGCFLLAGSEMYRLAGMAT